MLCATAFLPVILFRSESGVKNLGQNRAQGKNLAFVPNRFFASLGMTEEVGAHNG
ncbi:MAG: hypothetical protein ACI35M_02070 [Alistipes sp.]